MPLTREQQVVASMVKELLGVVPVLSEVNKSVLDNPTNIGNMVNTLWLCKKVKEVTEAIEKEVNKIEYSTSERVCTLLAVTEQPNAKTEYATVSPKPETYVKYPNKPGDEGYDDFVRKLSPSHVRPHYPTICETIIAEVGAGRQFPFGLEKEKIYGIKLGTRVLSKKDL